MDSYSVLTSIIEALKLLSDESFELLVTDTIAEYRRHLASEAAQKLRDGEREMGIIRKVDAIVDAVYYALDAAVRCGVNPDVTQSEALVDEDERDFVATRERAMSLYRDWFGKVEAFVEGAFGQVGLVNPTAHSKFMMTMVLSEILEFNDFSPSASEQFLRQLRRKSGPSVTGVELEELWACHITNIAITLITYGLDHWEELFTDAFREVHQANMRKGRVDAEGKLVFETKVIGDSVKIIKPAGWTAADLRFAFENTFKNA